MICRERLPVERLVRGDVVQAVAYGPLGRVTDPNRRGWTLVAWPRDTVMCYKHGSDSLFLVREGASRAGRARRVRVPAAMEGTMTKYTDTDSEGRDELCDRIYVLESALEQIAVGGLSNQEMTEIAGEALEPTEATARHERA